MSDSPGPPEDEDVPVGDAADPTRADLDAVALAALQRMQQAARAHGDLRHPLGRRGSPRSASADDVREALQGWARGGPDLVDEDDAPFPGTLPVPGVGDEDGAAAAACEDPADAWAPTAAPGTGPAVPGEQDARRYGVLGSVARTARRAGTRWSKAPGMAASRTRWREPEALGSFLGRAVRDQGWDGPTAMGSVLAKWQEIVGPNLAEHCEVETFEGQRLVVRCSSTAWAKQLRLLLPHVERRIDEEVGPGVVTQVIVRGPAAPSWRKGRRSVPGRGPRDTYG